MIATIGATVVGHAAVDTMADPPMVAVMLSRTQDMADAIIAAS